MLPQTTGELYDLLAADAPLLALLGTYTFRSGDTAPALSRLWRREDEAERPVCSGLEVAIARLGTTDTRGLFTGEVARRVVMRAYVTQWSVPEGEEWQLEAAVERILDLLEGTASSTPNDLPEGLNGLGQVVIRYEPPETTGAPVTD